jgi:hypothetical protein
LSQKTTATIIIMKIKSEAYILDCNDRSRETRDSYDDVHQPVRNFCEATAAETNKSSTYIVGLQIVDCRNESATSILAASNSLLQDVSKLIVLLARSAADDELDESFHSNSFPGSTKTGREV